MSLGAKNVTRKNLYSLKGQIVNTDSVNSTPNGTNSTDGSLCRPLENGLEREKETVNYIVRILVNVTVDNNIVQWCSTSLQSVDFIQITLKNYQSPLCFISQIKMVHINPGYILQITKIINAKKSLLHTAIPDSVLRNQSKIRAVRLSETAPHPTPFHPCVEGTGLSEHAVPTGKVG